MMQMQLGLDQEDRERWMETTRRAERAGLAAARRGKLTLEEYQARQVEAGRAEWDALLGRFER